jgi:hypothetical protein
VNIRFWADGPRRKLTCTFERRITRCSTASSPQMKTLLFLTGAEPQPLEQDVTTATTRETTFGLKLAWLGKLTQEDCR